jgi:hypothetical protein
VATILSEAAAVFAACLSLHVVMWRVRRPTAYRQWVPALMLIFLAFGSAFAWFLVRSDLLAVDAWPLRADPLLEWVAVLLLHGAVSAVYIIGYTLVSAFSPSIEMLKLLERHPEGLRRADIDLPYLRTALGGDRISNLLAGELIHAEGDSVRLGPGAQGLTRVVLFYRHMIGLPDGAGG